MNIEDLQAYHKHITDTYDERSGNHDNSDWYRKTALRLVGELPARPGDSYDYFGTIDAETRAILQQVAADTMNTFYSRQAAGRVK